MSTEQEALRLANRMALIGASMDGDADRAAAMLRKLVAEREEYRAAMRRALEALNSCDAEHVSDGGRQFYDEKSVDAAITDLRQRLEGTT